MLSDTPQMSLELGHHDPMGDRLREAVEPPGELRLKVNKRDQERAVITDLTEFETPSCLSLGEIAPSHKQDLTLRVARVLIMGQEEERRLHTPEVKADLVLIRPH